MPCLPSVRLCINARDPADSPPSQTVTYLLRGRGDVKPPRRPRRRPPRLASTPAFSPHLYKHLSMAPPRLPTIPSTPGLSLLDLPPETLEHVMRHVLGRAGAYASPAIGADALRAALPAGESCRAMGDAMSRAMDAVCMPPPATDDTHVGSLARRTGTALRDLVLRSCARVSDIGVLAVAAHATRLRAVDLSFVPGVTDRAVQSLCLSAAGTLTKVLLRKCERLTDLSADAIAGLAEPTVVDLSYVPHLTDAGVSSLAAGAGSTLRMLSIAHCPLLTDASLSSLGKSCSSLDQLCARALPKVTNAGFETLCAGVGLDIAGIDVLDCPGLTREGVLRSLREHCPRVCGQMPESGIETRSLRHIIVTTLRSNIYIVQGCDPASGRDTIHMLLVDNGDIVSANILSAGTTDLSLLGTVLCKGYGTSLDQETKEMLASDYGILPSMLSD